MNVYAYIGIALCAVGIAIIPSAVGKPREPLTAGTATAMVVSTMLQALLFFLAATR